MNVRIAFPQAIHEVGGRKNNEDSIWPPMNQATNQDRLFLVCDGVGGARKGDVASQIVSKGFATFFSQNPPNGAVDKSYLEMGLQSVESQLSAYTQAHPECEGMATTLTLLYLNEQGATIAWVGDSKVYQFRKGQILYETEDHSLVQKLVREGAISPEEAVHHPHKNVIMRAIKGSEEPTEIDVWQTSNLGKDDLFLLCSDGITENWTSKELAQLTHRYDSPAEIKRELLAKSTGRTDDNFSAYVVRIEGNTGEDVLIANTAESVLDVDPLDPTPSGSKIWKWTKVLLGAFIALCVFAFLFLIFSESSLDDEVRRQVEHSLQEKEYVKAVFWADTLINMDHDEEQKKKYLELRSRAQRNLIKSLNEGESKSLTLLACEQLQKEVGNARSSTLDSLLTVCENNLSGPSAVKWMQEGDFWWSKNKLGKARKCYARSKKVETTDALKLRLKFLDKAEEGISDPNPLDILQQVEKADEHFEEQDYGNALIQYEKIAPTLNEWELSDLVTPKIATCLEKNEEN